MKDVVDVGVVGEVKTVCGRAKMFHHLKRVSEAWAELATLARH